MGSVWWAALAWAKAPEIVIARGPETLHPLYGWTAEDQLVASLVHERLFERDGRDGWRSDVVTDTRIEGTNVTLTLASVDWHDGRPLVAADVCATLDRIRSADRPTPFTPTAAAWVVSCVPDDRDPRRVHLTLAAPHPVPAEVLSFPLVPAHRPEWVGAGPQSALEPIGLGPYSVSRDALGWHLSGGSRAPFKRLDLVVAPDPVSEVTSGRGVAAPFVAAADLPELRAHPELAIEVEPASSVWALMVNPSRGPLGDPRVRQALDLSIDRTALGAALLGRDPELAAQPWVPVGGPELRPATAPVTLRDPEVAAALLTEAGLVRTDAGWSFHDQPVSLRVVTPLGLGPDPAKLQAALSQQLDGFRVEVVPLSSTQWWFSLLAGAHAPVTDLALFPIDVRDLGAVFHSRTPTSGLHNPFGWSDPAVDAALDQRNAAERQAAVDRIVDAAPALFLWVANGRSAWMPPYEALRSSLSAQ
ncbi:MAG: ABC transporter substrate-binding protein [Myxococcota bacterium]